MLSLHVTIAPYSGIDKYLTDTLPLLEAGCMSCLQNRHPDLKVLLAFLFVFYPETDDSFKPESVPGPFALSDFALYEDDSPCLSHPTLRDSNVVACITTVIAVVSIFFSYRRSCCIKKIQPQPYSSNRMALGGLTSALPLGGGDGMPTPTPIPCVLRTPYMHVPPAG